VYLQSLAKTKKTMSFTAAIVLGLMRLKDAFNLDQLEQAHL
jgi:hypothetical protein